MKIKIPYKLVLNELMVEKGYGDIEYNPEPFHTRESLEATLRHKVLSHVMRSATVEIDEKTLDKALAACNSIVAEIENEERDDMPAPEPLDYVPLTSLEEYENDRLNTTTEPDEDDSWLLKHYTLSGVDRDKNDDYDTEALIKTVLAYENY